MKITDSKLFVPGLVCIVVQSSSSGEKIQPYSIQVRNTPIRKDGVLILNDFFWLTPTGFIKNSRAEMFHLDCYGIDGGEELNGYIEYLSPSKRSEIAKCSFPVPTMDPVFSIEDAAKHLQEIPVALERVIATLMTQKVSCTETELNGIFHSTHFIEISCMQDQKILEKCIEIYLLLDTSQSLGRITEFDVDMKSSYLFKLVEKGKLNLNNRWILEAGASDNMEVCVALVEKQIAKYGVSSLSLDVRHLLNTQLPPLMNDEMLPTLLLRAERLMKKLK